MIQVGAGAWGSSWAGIVASSSHWELAALVDPDEAALTRVADAVRVPAERRFGSLSDAAAAGEADAVLVAVPPRLHGAVALQALESGFHCLAEKPLATSIGESQQVVKRAHEAGLLLMASQNFRFERGYRTVQALLANRAIGEVGAVWIDFRRAPLFVGFRLEMEEPLLIDMAIHHLDQLRGLGLGRPISLRARSFNPSWSSFHGNAVATVEVTMEGDSVASYAGSWAARGPETPWSGAWRLEGGSGAIVWSGDSVEVFPAEAPPSRLRRLRRRAQERVPLVTLPEVGRAGVLAEFAAAIRERREPETSGRDNLGTLRLVFAAVESAQRGEAISLPEAP